MYCLMIFLEEITIVFLNNIDSFSSYLIWGVLYRHPYEGQFCKALYHVLKIKAYSRDAAVALALLAISEPKL